MGAAWEARIFRKIEETQAVERPVYPGSWQAERGSCICIPGAGSLPSKEDSRFANKPAGHPRDDGRDLCPHLGQKRVNWEQLSTWLQGLGAGRGAGRLSPPCQASPPQPCPTQNGRAPLWRLDPAQHDCGGWGGGGWADRSLLSTGRVRTCVCAWVSALPGRPAPCWGWGPPRRMTVSILCPSTPT